MTSQPFDIDSFLEQLPSRPGVYRMLNAQDTIIYVGKAVSLKSRVTSYFRGRSHNNKTQVMVSKVASIEVTITHSEAEALLLENTLIKTHKPPYNISMRDDKSYPYIFISDKHQFPAIQYVRGSRKRQGQYFGPYTNAKAVQSSLYLLQKIFHLRQCEDAFFNHRQRPCLQFQINRCSGPCTGEISAEAYANDVRHATLYLEGKNKTLLTKISQAMVAAAEDLAFERAAALKEQLAHLRQIQEQQHVIADRGDVDIFAADMSSAGQCIHLLMVRKGQIVGSKNFFPKWSLATTKEDLLGAFLGQYYLSGNRREIPNQTIVSDINEPLTLQEAIASLSDSHYRLSTRVRGQRAKWLQLAQTNANQALQSHTANRQTQLLRFQALQSGLQLEQLPKRIECFDISHHSGADTVASCVVFDQAGPKKSDYRLFNIEGITASDDYAAMKQALTRRYSRLVKGEGVLPNILIIDGGKGQITQAMQVLEALAIDNVKVIGVAKGETRKAGLEKLIDGKTRQEIVFPNNSPALHLLQHIRDESHRFAINGHRARRKNKGKSKLQSIDGVGAKRRQSLLRHFGSLQEISKASVEEICKVDGINNALANTIYAALRGEQSA